MSVGESYSMCSDVVDEPCGVKNSLEDVELFEPLREGVLAFPGESVSPAPPRSWLFGLPSSGFVFGFFMAYGPP